MLSPSLHPQGTNPENLKWYVQAELVHARFAMLGAAGVLAPELLSKIGLGGPVAQVPWYDAGKYEFSFAATVRTASPLGYFAGVRPVGAEGRVHCTRYGPEPFDAAGCRAPWSWLSCSSWAGLSPSA